MGLGLLTDQQPQSLRVFFQIEDSVRRKVEALRILRWTEWVPHQSPSQRRLPYSLDRVDHV